RRSQHLLGPAEPRNELVREREHLRRGAVVLREPYDGRVRKARGHAEQMLGPGAGEAVDRLVVVADNAEVVAIAESELEQRLLEQVDVLVLVDGERVVLGAERHRGALVVLEHAHGAFEQVLEVEEPFRLLTPLIVEVDARHQIRGDRRLAVLGGVEVVLGVDAAVLRPVDLGGKVARRPELVGRAQTVADLAEEERLRRKDAAEPVRCEMPELPERRGVERAGAHAGYAERRETRAQFAARLVGERHRHDPGRIERAGLDLLRDSAGDRRRLAGACAREDADGAAHRLGGAPLLRVQAGERVHRTTVATRPAGNVTRPARSRRSAAQESRRSSAARSVGSPCAGSTSSTGRSSSGRSRRATSSRVTCVRPPSWMSSPSPKSESESPETMALIDGSQRMRSLSSRPAYAWMPNGHAPGPWKCPRPSSARSQARSSLSMPRTRSGSTPNFSTQSCQVSAGGVCTARPSPRASRSWYGAVRTTAVARSRRSSGTESGSNNRKSSPSSTAYDETSSGHHCSSSQSGCGDCQCQTPGRSSRMGAMLWVA